MAKEIGTMHNDKYLSRLSFSFSFRFIMCRTGYKTF